jgi:hypothetical protein
MCLSREEVISLLWEVLLVSLLAVLVALVALVAVGSQALQDAPGL